MPRYILSSMCPRVLKAMMPAGEFLLISIYG